MPRRQDGDARLVREADDIVAAFTGTLSDSLFVLKVPLNRKQPTDRHVAAFTFVDSLLPARRRPQGLVVIGVCLSVCLCALFFVRKISQERVHGSPPNLVGGSRG